MKPENVPSELATLACLSESLDETSARHILAAVLPTYERLIRNQIATELDAHADRATHPSARQALFAAARLAGLPTGTPEEIATAVRDLFEENQ